MGRKKGDIVIPSNQEILKRVDKLEGLLKKMDKRNAEQSAVFLFYAIAITLIVSSYLYLGLLFWAVGIGFDKRHPITTWFKNRVNR